jgi:pimeloyl-ACP methyl ester carboxylesterase
MLSVISLSILTAVLVLAVFVGFCMARATYHQHEDRMASSPPDGSFVDAGDTKLFVQQEGDQNAPVVVFIHGTGSWSETWRAAMEQVAKQGYRAVAIDLPPFGFSLPPESGDYSKVAQATRLLAALDSMGIQHAAFVAHSFGSAPVVEALLSNPNRATSLVLVDAALGLDGPQADGSDNSLQRVLRVKWISNAISATYLTNPYFTKSLLQSFITEKDKATPDWVALYQRPLSLSGSYQQVALWLPNLLADRGLDKSDDPLAYKQLTFPVTLIWGETDTITPISQAEHLQGFLPNAKLIKIPKSGHIPQIEEPEFFLASLNTALNRQN